MNVIKRDGSVVPFDKVKIYRAVCKCRDAVSPQVPNLTITIITTAVETELGNRNTVHVEEIQDIVEDKLIDFRFKEMAKAYINYRYKHKIRRDLTADLMATYNDILFVDAESSDLKRDNANVNTNAPMGIMLKLGSEGAKFFANNYAVDQKFMSAHQEKFIHAHDLDFSLITLNCCQIDLLKVFNGGFSTGHGYIREPNSIRSAAALACIVIQANQNDMFGGQSINAFDFAMAPYVRKSFRTTLRRKIEEACNYTGTQIQDFDVVDFCHYSDRVDFKSVKMLTELLRNESLAKKIYIHARDAVKEETHQAMEAVIHNFNSLHSRAGAQVPFSSINYGLDTSPEGRLVTLELLNAINAGMGHGETPIFPISVFQLKSGVNYNVGDPNYDLFKLACKVSAKRLYPNFLNIDATFNRQYYKAGDYNSTVATMGCRTRVMSNVNGPEESGSRGNFAFVTINLPKLALEANRNFNKFIELYDHYIDLCREYLLARLKIIANKQVRNFPFLMGQGVWMDSEKLKPTEKIADVLKHASYSIGFCGLAECLVALTGKHHGENSDAQAIGLKIVEHLRNRTDEFTDRDHMNWTAFATPAESTCGTFQRANQKKFGIIDGVTDRPYMTNSFHVPVYYKINAFDKIKIEAPYHALCNAGHISYIEWDGDPLDNLPAFEKVVRAMHDANMGYFSINHPVDYDPVCGYTGIIANECPKCHRHENDDQIPFLRQRRVTGYLSTDLSTWNDAKRAEEHDRVKHNSRLTS